MSLMTEEEYIEQRLDDQIAWFDRKSSLNQSRFQRLKVLEIVAASSVPVLVAFGVEKIAAVSGALVAVISGVVLLYKFDETWTDYRSTWSALLSERMLHQTGVEPYNDEATRYERLVRRVEGILGEESKAWQEIRAPSQESN